MLMRSVSRFAVRRCSARLMAAPSHLRMAAQGEVKDSTTYAKEVVEPNIPNQTKKTPETVAEFKKSVQEILTPPTKHEVMEGVGYLGQKHGSGGITTLARIDYGPHRYDYGRPTMPTSHFGCFFYGAWEFGHIMLVSDKYVTIRFWRHIFGALVFFTPAFLLSEHNRKQMERGPPWLRDD